MKKRNWLWLIAFVPLLMSSSCAGLDLSLAPQSVTVQQNGAAQTVTVSLNRMNLNGAVELTTSGLPTGVTASFSPSSVSGNSSTLSLSATSAAVIGKSVINVVGTTGGGNPVSRQLALEVTAASVTAKPSITKFTATPATLPAAGGSVTLTWDAQNASSLEIDGGIGAVTPINAGSKAVTVSATTTFTLTAKNGNGTETKSATVTVGSAVDTTPPTVFSIDPPNGATGIRSDTNVTVTFSEPMKKLETQSAYQSAVTGLKAADVTFDWNANGTVLTVKPNAPLTYSSGTDPSTVIAQTYSFNLSSIATDLAGNVLTGIGSSFKTLRQISATVYSSGALDGHVYSDGAISNLTINILVGDNESNLGARGLLSFDLSSLPDAVLSGNLLTAKLFIEKGNMFGSPFVKLKALCNTTFCPPSTGSVGVDHVSYGATLTAGAYSTPSLAKLPDLDTPAFNTSGPVGFFETTTPDNTKNLDALEAVRNDWDNRAARGKRSQFRLSFQRDTDGNGAADQVLFYSGNTGDAKPALRLEYLIP